MPCLYSHLEVLEQDATLPRRLCKLRSVMAADLLGSGVLPDLLNDPAQGYPNCDLLDHRCFRFRDIRSHPFDGLLQTWEFESHSSVEDFGGFVVYLLASQENVARDGSQSWSVQLDIHLSVLETELVSHLPEFRRKAEKW